MRKVLPSPPPPPPTTTISSTRPWRLASGVPARDTRSGCGSPTPSSPGAGEGLPGMEEGRLPDGRTGAASSRLPPPPPWQVEKRHRLLRGQTASSGHTGQPRLPASLAWSWTWESLWGKECDQRACSSARLALLSHASSFAPPPSAGTMLDGGLTASPDGMRGSLGLPCPWAP